MTTTLIIDGHNFMHRSRAGFGKGDFSIVYTFFRTLRYLVEQQDPDNVLFVLEGHPQHRFDLLPEYKANRIAEPGSAKDIEMTDFHRQKDLIVDILTKCFPIAVLQHPRHECDDTIYNVIRNGDVEEQFIVVSNDTDFIQLLQKFDNVRIFNPMKKEYVAFTEKYDYVAWKSLTGDGADNIDGFKGIGGKRAKALLEVPGALEKFFKEDSTRSAKFNRNFELISFVPWTESEASDATCSSPIKDWEYCRKQFQTWQFNSLLKEKPWAKFIATFDKFWPIEENEQDQLETA